MIRKILFGFGLSTFTINAAMYMAMRHSLKFHGAAQLTMVAVGFLCLLLAAVMHPEKP